MDRTDAWVRRLRPLACGLLNAILACTLLSPAIGADARHEIHFPNLPGYQTLKCDLHMHTVFSDGSVWPPVRVTEAWRQGLDVISITDHIEYQPHKDDLRTSHNRPYDLAVGNARSHNVLLVKGAEITRDTPPGHFNALFLSDINPLDTDEFLGAIDFYSYRMPVVPDALPAGDQMSDDDVIDQAAVTQPVDPVQSAAVSR